ncbi:MAG: GDP-fucose synthetase [Parcubacteria group bacterium]|jgi:GDP-L-fucose synthase|nr:GDP-fucose synthetase [Parcubacteria group bacterium]|tara:strand:- start:5083 stop:6012 length:930 start_codon:yes stop_codon:yes gene_type:complete
MQKNDKIYIAGHQGLVGSAIVRQLVKRGYNNLITKSRSEVDLTSQKHVKRFFEEDKPNYIFMAAGKTGGVYANNTYRAEFIYENLILQTNIIHQAFLSEVKKLIFFGCSSMYPQTIPQPVKEEHLLSGYLEPTNEPFAVAKIAGLKMCESYNRQYGTDFISVIPTNLYGINQNYEPMNSLVVPALIQKIHDAMCNNSKEVVLWGSGRPSRDFLFSDDLADAVIFLMQNYSGNEVFNIGTGKDYTVRDLAEIVKEVIGYTGEIVYDISKPDGVLVKLQDISKITKLGWQYKVELKDGICRTYESFVAQKG